MNRLHSLLARIGSWLDMVSGAYGATAAIRVHQTPAATDLKRLGIKPKSFTVRL
jgi:hypothetical protein